MCKINPKVDFAFKKLFGSEENKDLLISLINAIVSEEDQVADLKLKNPYNLANYQAGKMPILDIKARDTAGRWFNVEMQMAEDRNFDKRALFHIAKNVTDQLTEGQMFRKLHKTISINILDFNFVPGEDNFHSRHKIINTKTREDDRLHDMFELHYIELKKFRKEFSELATPLDRWVAFLSRAYQLDKNNLPETLTRDAAITKAIMAVDRMFDEDERQIYETRIQVLADMESKIASAEEKGENLGREREKLTIARNLLPLLDDVAIADNTGLPFETVQELRKEFMD